MRLCKAVACWVLLGLVPSITFALGLGEIRLNSALNQPFSAEVPLESVNDAQLRSVRVSMADADAFDRLNLDRPIFLNDFTFIVRKNDAGEPVVKIVSRIPVSEPFVTFLLDVKWGSGRLQREYTVLLDPPVFEDIAVQSAPVAVIEEPVVEEFFVEPAEIEEAAPAEPQVAETFANDQVVPEISEPEVVAETGSVEPRVTAETEVLETEVAETEVAETEVVETQAEAVAADEVLAQPAPVQQPPAPVEASEPELADNYTTQEGETLWRIASQSKAAGLSTNQMMLAIYRANPEAFLGNINAMKAGAILRLPSAEEAGELSISEAEAEAKQQHSSWTDGTDSSAAVADASEAGSGMQLELVPPSEALPVDDGQGVAEGNTDLGGLSDEAAVDEGLLSVEDAELNALQERTAAEEQAADLEIQEMGEPVTESEAAVQVEGIEEPIESPFADEAELLEDDSVVTTPIEEPVTPEPVEDLSSQQGGIVDLLMSYGLYAGGALLVLIALFLFRRRSNSAAAAPAAAAPVVPDADQGAHEDTLTDFADQPAAESQVVVDEVDAALTEDNEAPDVVEEPAEEPEPDPLFDDLAETSIPDVPAEDLTATDAIADFDESEPETTIDRESYEKDVSEENRGGRSSDYNFTDTVTENDVADTDLSEFGVQEPTEDAETPLEKTISTGAPLNLDQADPTAEADFHMAYGLYDQAADLLVNALIEEPENREYRVKLIEVYFVWENKEGFLEQAKALHDSVADDSDPDWNKVLILGKQLCPDAELFAGGDAVAPAADSMDLEFSEDEGEMDLDLSLGGTEVQALDEGAVADDTLDFDLGSAVADGDNEEFKLNLAGDDDADDGDEIDPAATIKIDEDDLEMVAEAPILDAPAADAPTVEADMLGATVESPTLEMPDESALTANMPALDHIDLDGLELGDAESAEAEPSPDDSGTLDVDLSGLADFGESSEPADPKMDIDSTLNQLDNTGELLKPEDVEDFSRTLTEEDAPAEVKDELANTLGDNDATEIVNPADLPHLKMPDLGDTLEQPDADSGETAQQPVDESAETAEQPSVDVLGDADATLEVPIGGIPDDATMTEVGTKLDLARAYIDMGDPDGARSILQEVLEEGGEPQQNEARQLLEELGD